MQELARDALILGNESAGDKFRGGQPAIIPITDKEQPDCCRAGGAGGAGIGLDGLSALGDLGPDTGTIDTKIAAGAVKKVKVKPKWRRDEATLTRLGL